jgi:hypothetical protein
MPVTIRFVSFLSYEVKGAHNWHTFALPRSPFLDRFRLADNSTVVNECSGWRLGAWA